MAIQTVNLGAPITGEGGDKYRDAHTKINANFTELYQRIESLESRILTLEPLDLVGFFAGKIGFLPNYSDKLTLFKDAAGTQPVTADGDPVGLVLDKSKGLVLGSEILPSANFLSGWTFSNNKDNTANNGMISLSPITGFGAFASYLLPAYTLTAGKFYKVQCKVLTTDVAAGNIRISMVVQAPYEAVPVFNSTIQNGVMTGYFKISNSASNITFRLQHAGNVGTIQFSEPSLKEIKGNHAMQTVSALRPLYKTDGTSHWLYHDKVDDKLLVTLPAMTATVATSTDDGTFVNHPVIIAADGYTLLSASTLGRDYGGVIINKELSEVEKAQVTKYLNEKRGV